MGYFDFLITIFKQYLKNLLNIMKLQLQLQFADFTFFLFFSALRSCFSQWGSRRLFKLSTLGEFGIRDCVHLRKPNLRWRKAQRHFGFSRFRDDWISHCRMADLEESADSFKGGKQKQKWQRRDMKDHSTSSIYYWNSNWCVIL